MADGASGRRKAPKSLPKRCWNGPLCGRITACWWIDTRPSRARWIRHVFRIEPAISRLPDSAFRAGSRCGCEL